MVDALVIEPDRDSTGREEHGHAIPSNKRSRMVDLKPPSAVQLDRENLKRLPLPQTLEDVVEALRRHGKKLPAQGQLITNQ
jgi:ribosomal 50S subunit-associated protein YjgA (DUF615 family)